MSRTSRTSWMKRVCCWPHNRVHPISDSTEELPEDHLEGLSVSRLEEEAPPNSIAREQASEHVPQEDMVVELPQDWAEDEPLKTVDESGEACEHAPQEHVVVELPQAGAEESPLQPLEAAGAANEHDFTEDLPVNPPCDNTEETQCFSKVALSGCESDCFVENVSSNDAEENAATPDECCPQTPRNCMVHIEDLEESKTIEIPKRSLVIFLKTASGEVSSDDEEDLEEQE
ncbi:uncharacterized protein [Bos indicus]